MKLGNVFIRTNWIKGANDAGFFSNVAGTVFLVNTKLHECVQCGLITGPKTVIQLDFGVRDFVGQEGIHM